MKKELIQLTFLIITFFFCFPQMIQAQQIEKDEVEEGEEVQQATSKKKTITARRMDAKVVEDIAIMTNLFNKHRSKTSQIYVEHGYDSEKMIENERRIAETDLKNRKIAKAIYKEHGYPTISMVGAEKAHEFWVVVQNCNFDTDFQLAVLKDMDRLILEDEADRRDYAYLSDRVRINLGMKQVYGTQLRYNEATKSYEPFELNNPTELEERRKEMNLEKMEVYVQTMNDNYQGTPKRKARSKRSLGKP